MVASKRTVFRLVIKEGEVPVRKRIARPARPMPKKTEKRPRHKPEYGLEDEKRARRPRSLRARADL